MLVLWDSLQVLFILWIFLKTLIGSVFLLSVLGVLQSYSSPHYFECSFYVSVSPRSLCCISGQGLCPIRSLILSFKCSYCLCISIFLKSHFILYILILYNTLHMVSKIFFHVLSDFIFSVSGTEPDILLVLNSCFLKWMNEIFFYGDFVWKL